MLTLQPVATILVICIVRYKRALEIQLKKLGAEHVDVASTYGNFGNLHSKLGEKILSERPLQACTRYATEKART